jgi:hypothetical protein
VANDWVTGVSTTGNASWTFRIEIPAGKADAYLPPSADHPWSLRVTEGGYLNRSGRIEDFRLIWHDPQGDQIFEGGPTPQQTLEGRTALATVPQGLVSVDHSPISSGLIFGPNPVRAGAAVTFLRGRPQRGDVRIFDLSGREIGHAAFASEEGGYRARWVTRDLAGHPLPSGVYFARVGEGAGTRVVVLKQ